MFLCFSKTLKLSHNPEVGGSNPSPATKKRSARSREDFGRFVISTRIEGRSFADKTFERTIRFVFFGSEENAPWTTKKFGSGYYAYQAKQAGENIVAMIQADALAYNASSETPRIVEMHTRRPKRDKGGGDAAIVTMWQDAIATYLIADLQAERYALSNRLSDHGSFWRWGYNAVLLLEETGSKGNPNWHQITDSASTFNWPYYEQATKNLVGLAAHQAGITP